jgi:transcriptional regulator with XRE-family HTH domain
MASRTRKWSFVEQDALRFAKLGLSEREIAKRLGVAKSTITRWKKSGKLPKDGPGPGAPGAAAVSPRLEPAEWARSVRAEYQLDSTDEALVTLGEAALSLSRSMTATVREQLAGSQRFQAIVRQLNLPGRRLADLADQKPAATAVNDAPARKVNPPVARESKADPRSAFMTVVK